MNAQAVTTALLVGSAAMALAALLYLARRRLAWWQAAAWGALALGVPILGPFMVICLRPRPFNPRIRPSAARRWR